MGTVTLTTEEYAELLSKANRTGEPARVISAKAKVKRKGRTARGMGAALREANRRARKKNGDFRKGYNQRRVMEMAHKIRRSKK
jgi:lysylphosphatidylglycerol synthetase-like protein (DUF2156 family)